MNILDEIGNTTKPMRANPVFDLLDGGGTLPSSKPQYKPTFLDNLLSGGGAEIDTLSDPSNPEAAAVVAATGGSLLTMPVAGIAGLAKTVTSGVTEGQKTLEGIGSIPGRLIKTEEQARAAGEIGRLTEPFQMAGRGWGALTELGSTAAVDETTGLPKLNWQSAADVAEGRSEGSNILVPASKAIGESAAMFGIPGVPKGFRDFVNGLPYRKRLMVIDQVKADIANGEFTGKQIRELWKDPANREELLKRYQGLGEEGRPSRPAFNEPPESGRALPEGQGFELRPRPDEVRSILDEIGQPGPKALPAGQGFETYPTPESTPFSPELAADIQAVSKKALPPGQGFELRPTPAEVKGILDEIGTNIPALPYPEGVGEGFVSKPGVVEPPIVTKAGEPFKTAKTAEQAGKGLDWNLYEVTPQEGGGFAITRKQGQEIRTPSAPVRYVIDAKGNMVPADEFVPSEPKPPEMRPIEPVPVEVPKMKVRTPENIVTAIQQMGGLNVYDDYNAPEMRQFPDMARVMKKSGLKPDEAAANLSSEFIAPDGQPFTGDTLIEYLKTGQGRNILNPAKAESIIERKFRSQENEWIEAQLASLDEKARLDAIAGDSKEHLEKVSLDEIAAEESLTPEELLAAQQDVADFFDTVAKPPKPSAYTGKTETTEIPGASLQDTFSLVNPETEIFSGDISKKDMTPTGGLFEKPPTETAERFIKERLESDVYYWKTGAGSKKPAAAERLKATTKTLNDFNRGKLTKDDQSYIERIKGEHHEKLIGSQRGSTGPVDESEILSALLKTQGKIADAMPHLEALGRSVYEGGKTRFLDWQASIKAKLGDLWESFKGHLRGIWDRLQSGEIGPMGNQKGAVGIDINKGKSEVKSVLSDIRKTADEYLGSISTRLGNIHPSLKANLRAFEYRRGRLADERTTKVLPFIEKVAKMTPEDKAAFDLARKNGDPVELKRLVVKHGLGKEYHELRTVLADMYQQAVSVGYDVGYRQNYHPRILKDTKGFLQYFYDHKDWPVLQKAIRAKETELQRYLTDDEKAKLINSMLRGYPSGQISLSKPGQLKAREIETVTPELNRFYYDSDASLLRYINDVTDAIEARKLFGAGAKGGKLGDMKDTIGGYTLRLINEGKIRPDQEQTLRNILDARFNEVGTRGIFGLYKNLSYIDTMGSPISAITQIGDLAWALYKNGIGRTAAAAGRAIVGRSPLKKEDIGIARIASEFSDTSKLARAVDKTFNAIGLTRIDAIGKESLITSTYESAMKKALTERGTTQLRKELEPIFEGETDQVLTDIRQGKITENVKLYLFNVLSDFQPISLSEMPQMYLTGGNGRIFYMLKTFTLKQYDVFRREAFQKIATEGQRAQGMANLVKLAASLMAANATADVIKDFILGRPIDIGDKVVDNLLRLGGVSKFVTWKAREEGVGSAMVRQIAPPFKLADAITKDIAQAGDEKGLEVTQSIPIVGKLYYWWFGKGAGKSERQAAKGGGLVDPNLKGLRSGQLKGLR